jgi:serine/threonine-protein kinase
LFLHNIIVGKWNKHKYKILKKIGHGNIGEVYKVSDNKGNIRVMKLSTDLSSITREYSFMEKMKDLRYIPKVYEIDDYQKNSQTFNFIIMDYIEGENFKAILRKGSIGNKNVVGIGIILLNILERIYKEGYFYGDLKLENIVLDKKKKRIMLIDFGSIIEKNEVIKEYTPSYNTTSWGIETDKNREIEIIFGVSMILNSMLLNKEFNPLKYTFKQVIHNIKNSKLNKELKDIIIKGLKLKYKNINLYKRDLIKIFNKLEAVDEDKVKAYEIIVNRVFIASICFFVFTLVLWVKCF